MSDCRFGVSPVNYPDPDPDPDSYAKMSSVVNWIGGCSKPFVEQQDVRQGGIILPSAYEMFLNPFLNMYSANRLCLRIGSVFLGSPACPDNLLFLARSAVELQEMICVQEFYANDEHYDISDTKIKVFIVNSVLSTKQWYKNGIFNLNGSDIEVVEECTHLGLQRDKVQARSC